MLVSASPSRTHLCWQNLNALVIQFMFVRIFIYVMIFDDDDDDDVDDMTALD